MPVQGMAGRIQGQFNWGGWIENPAHSCAWWALLAHWRGGGAGMGRRSILNGIPG